MKINKVIKPRILVLILLSLSLNALAEVSPYKTYETSSLKIKLSNDGTGIVQGIQCNACGYNLVKITANSRATARGVSVAMVEVKKRAGKPAMISFTPSTREVQFIRW